MSKSKIDDWRQQIRKLALSLLDDEDGISEASYMDLYALLTGFGHDDIAPLVQSIDGRFFLPENHGLT